MALCLAFLFYPVNSFWNVWMYFAPCIFYIIVVEGKVESCSFSNLHISSEYACLALLIIDT
jgi:hypothetical protein